MNEGYQPRDGKVGKPPQGGSGFRPVSTNGSRKQKRCDQLNADFERADTTQCSVEWKLDAIKDFLISRELDE